MKTSKMKTKKVFFVVTILPILLMGGQDVFARSERPLWVDGYHYDANNSYLEVVTATGWEVANARDKAYDEILRRRGVATGTNAKVTTSSGNISVESNHNLIVKARVLDEYVEELRPGFYKVYLLVQTAKNPMYNYEQVTITDKYPFSARCFVPGMAQIHKGSIAKGGVIIGAEAIGVAGIVTSFSMKASNEWLIKDDPKHAQTYADRAYMWQNIGYGCIAFTAAVYIYNIIDGAVARGQKRIFVNNTVAIAPTVTFDGNAGIAIRYNF
ncbi:MAG: hypothetical protein IJ621_06150 [Paludibacteraceae bacterium]|nr:hypothetical protein [Paludibacteraceae bacterium]